MLLFSQVQMDKALKLKQEDQSRTTRETALSSLTSRDSVLELMAELMTARFVFFI
jgi:hypothetical protein